LQESVQKIADSLFEVRVAKRRKEQASKSWYNSLG